MKLKDYFLLGIKAGLCKKRAWVNMLFNEIIEKSNDSPMLYQPFFEDGQMYFYMPDSNEKIYIDDYIPNRIPYHFRDEFILNPGDIENYNGTEPLVTTYGNVFINYLCLVLPLGNIIPFQVGYIDPSKLEKLVLERLIDDRADGDVTTPAPDGKIYVWQYLMFCEYFLSIPGYADTLVTPVSKKSLLPSPDRTKVRDKWVMENASRLTDPAAIAELTVEVNKLDKEYLAGDDTEEFYSSKGKLAGARRKMHYFFGGEAPFSDGTKVEFIAKSLDEGIDTDHLTVMINSARFGSYNRGAQTALGGVEVKTIYRMVGTVRIIEEDCKTTIGVPTYVDEYNATSLLGYSYIDTNGSVVITKENINGLIDRYISVRGPGTCKSGRSENSENMGQGKNICATCVGKLIAENPNGIPAAAAGVGGRFLSLFLSKMHSTQIRTVHWDMTKRLT